MLSKFWQWLKPPVYEQEEKNREAIWLQAVLLFIALTTLIIAAITLFFPQTSASWRIALISFSVAVVSIWFNRRGNFAAATLLILLWLLGDATYTLYIGNGIHDTALLFFSAIVTLGGLLLRRRAYFILVMLAILAISWIIHAEVNGWIVSPLSSKTDYGDIVMITAFLGAQALSVALLINSYFQSLQSERRNAQTLRALLDAATDPMFLIDAEGRLIDTNEALLPLLGRSKSELLRMRIFDFLPPAQVAASRALVQEIIQSGQPRGIEDHFNGRWFNSRFVPSLDENGQTDRIAVYIRDVTSYKKAEEATRSLNAELERRVAERTAQLQAANQELEAFSYSVSHDLRAPLRSINGFAGILNEDYADQIPAEARDYLVKISLSGEKMSHLIDKLLDFSRLGRKPLNRQQVELEPLLHAVIDALAPETAGRQIEWLLADLPFVNADPLLLQQVYANLLGNALKYTARCAIARIEVGSLDQDGGRVYYVRDNGAGFDMQYADRLFGVFQRLHSETEFKGTGIGLAIVRRIIERHGGRVWAEAKVDQGATFYFTLDGSNP